MKAGQQRECEPSPGGGGRQRTLARRLAGLLLALVVLPGGGLVGWWLQADYVVLRSTDTQLCRVTKWPLADNETLGDSQATLAAACNALETRLADTACASVAAATADECSPGDPKSLFHQAAVRLVAAPWAGDPGPLASMWRLPPLEWPGWIKHRFADIQSIGGKACKDAETRTTVNLTIGTQNECLAFMADDRTLVTAAHCLERAVPEAVVHFACASGTVQGICRPMWEVAKDCTSNDFADADKNCRRDIAVCRLDKSPTCAPATDMVVQTWVPAAGASSLAVLSRGGKDTCAKFEEVQLVTESSWPSQSPLPQSPLELMFTSPNMQIKRGDSGGLVRAKVGNQLHAIGVIVTGGKQPYAVPTWVVDACNWAGSCP